MAGILQLLSPIAAASENGEFDWRIPAAGEVGEFGSMYRMEQKHIELYFPKFKLNKSYNLERKLRQMGMMMPFTNAANFSGISSSYRLKISKVIHKAAIGVDETGTEAAAVTGVSAVPYSLPPVIKVDHPFIFMIYEEITKTLLFIGRVKDPTKL